MKTGRLERERETITWSPTRMREAEETAASLRSPNTRADPEKMKERH